MVAALPPVTRTPHSIYFDTPDASLAAAGMALRIRRSGRRWIQTFKCGGGVDSGLHRREEYEAPAPAGILNLPALADTPVAAMLSKADFIDHLQPVFVTRFRRTTRDVDSPAPNGRVRDGSRRGDGRGATRPINEVEIELRKRQRPAPRGVRAASGARGGSAPGKREQGAAGLPVALSVRKSCRYAAGTPALHPGMSATDALRTIVEVA
ncbi:MAG: CYTH domain-containing protein [Betaproteobacteria bacterium]|nr:CYTH domain-containing protein [Betaproteobacteria bacterium]